MVVFFQKASECFRIKFEGCSVKDSNVFESVADYVLEDRLGTSLFLILLLATVIC